MYSEPSHALYLQCLEDYAKDIKNSEHRRSEATTVLTFLRAIYALMQSYVSLDRSDQHLSVPWQAVFRNLLPLPEKNPEFVSFSLYDRRQRLFGLALDIAGSATEVEELKTDASSASNDRYGGKSSWNFEPTQWQRGCNQFPLVPLKPGPLSSTPARSLFPEYLVANYGFILDFPGGRVGLLLPKWPEPGKLYIDSS